MPIYTSSSGEEKDTADMPYTYLVNALRKAELIGDKDNMLALETEIALRDSQEVQT